MKNSILAHFARKTPRFVKFSLLLVATAGLTLTPAVASVSTYQQAVTTTASLVSYYTFDQSDATDSFGTNSGSVINGSFGAGVGGFGDAFVCDGSAQINLGPSSDFDFAAGSGSGTVEAWIRANWSSNPGYDPTLWSDGGGYNTEWSIHIDRNRGNIGMWNGNQYQTMPIPTLGTNWHHLATVFDNGEFKVYWDGQSLGSFFEILGLNPNETQIGSSAPWGGEGWMGAFDEVAFYSTALSQAEVQAHYQAYFSDLPPVIVKQPLGGTFLAGTPVSLSVVATGPNVAYQWYNNSTLLTGMTGPTLSAPSLIPQYEGTYYVVVSNLAGHFPSSNAVVAIGSRPAQLTQYQTVVSNEPGLISLYTFDGLTARDAFGTNEGTLQGTAAFAPGTGGPAGQGLWLDGGGQVNLGSTASFSFTSGIGSVEAWVRADWTTPLNYTPALFANRNRNSGVTDWAVHMTGDKKTLAIYNGSWSALYGIPGGGAGTNWHHIAAVFNNGTNTIYWDGAAIFTINQPIGGNPSTTQIGSSSPDSTTEGWVGMLDEVAFYSNALPAASVQAHYNAFYQGLMPVITVQPVGGNFLVGRPFATYAQAQGAQLVYQWYKDNFPIPGATGLTVGAASLAPGNSGVYYFTASNSVGVARSLNAVVHVDNNIARYQATVRGEADLISYYTFDSGDGSDALAVNNGTVSGSVSFTAGAGGVTNQALLLIGSGHINLGQVAAFDFVGGGTAEAWIRPDWDITAPPPYAPCIFADRSGGSVWSIHLEWGEFGIGNWNGDRFIELPISSASGWHHFAIVFDSGRETMYWDGQSLGTINQAINFNSGQSTEIGASDPGSEQEAWMGAIDEVAFYGAALSPDAINSHFLAMVGPENSPMLNYTVSGSRITFTWPASALGYTLESSGVLPGSTWNPVAGVVNNSVTVTNLGGDQFFRLRK